MRIRPIVYNVMKIVEPRNNVKVFESQYIGRERASRPNGVFFGEDGVFLHLQLHTLARSRTSS